MSIRTSVALAALLLVSALTAQWFGVDPDEQRRLQGVMVGLVLAIFANAIPKQLPPLKGSRLDAARAQAYQRFAGWTFAIAGLGHALLWLATPIPFADIASMVLVGGAIIVVFATCMVARSRVNEGSAE